MWRSGELGEDNPQLLTLVHGVDRKGSPVIRAYTGNARHPVYQEYQGVINKNYEKAARLSQISRGGETPMIRANNSSFDLYYFETASASTSTPRTQATSCWSPSLPSSGVRSPMIVPEIKGMRAIISRLRSSLAIHAGLGPATNSEINFLPVIPVRIRKPAPSNGLKNGRPTGNIASKKRECDSIKYSLPQEKVLPTYKESCTGCKGSYPQTRKTKKQKKKKGMKPKKLKPKLKPISDIAPLNSILSSKYLLS